MDPAGYSRGENVWGRKMSPRLLHTEVWGWMSEWVLTRFFLMAKRLELCGGEVKTVGASRASTSTPTPVLRQSPRSARSGGFGHRGIN